MNDFNKITTQGVVSYVSSYIETMKDRIKQGDPRSVLYEERILFFGKLLEICKTEAEKALKERETE